MLNFGEYFFTEEAYRVIREIDEYLNETINVTPTQPEDAVPTSSDSERRAVRYVDPMTQKKWRPADWVRHLDTVVKKEEEAGVDTNRLWVTFQDTPNFYPNKKMRSGKSTPYGVFAYPAKHVIKKAGSVESFGDRPYAILFRALGNQAEVGHKGPTAPEFKDVASGLEAFFNKGNWMNSAARMQRVFDKMISKWYAKSKIPDYDQKQRIRSLLNEAAKEIMGELGTRYRQTNNLADVNLDEFVNFDWVWNKLLGGGQKDVIQKALEEAQVEIYKPDDGYKYVNKYKNVNPEDLSAELNDEFHDYVKAYPSYFYVSGINLEQRLPIDTIYRAFEQYGILDTYTDAGKAYQRLKKAAKYEGDDKAKKLVVKLVDAIKKKLEAFKGSFGTDVQMPTVPYQDKLIELMKAYGIDQAELKDALEDARGTKNPQQFIYKVTAWLAKKVARELNSKRGGYSSYYSPPEYLEDGAKWQSIWARMLTKLGLDSAVDLSASSTIHSTEPSQGVFMDLSKIEPVLIIVKKTGAIVWDNTGRPDSSGRPNYFQGPTINRPNAIDHKQLKGTSAEGKLTQALQERAYKLTNTVQEKLYRIHYGKGSSYYDYDYDQPQVRVQKADAGLSLLIKVIKTIKRQMEQVPDANKVNLQATLLNVKGKLSNWMTYAGAQPNLMKKLEIIEKLVKDEEVQVPHMQRPWDQLWSQTMARTTEKAKQAQLALQAKKKQQTAVDPAFAGVNPADLDDLGQSQFQALKNKGV